MPLPHYRKYFAPRKGKLILDLSYMNMNENSELVITDGMIHVYSYSSVFTDDRNNSGEIENGTVYEDYTTVLLDHQNKEKTDFDGNVKIENDIYFKLKHNSALKEFDSYASA
jgi:hypothetical protein